MLLFPDPRPLVERLGAGFFRGLPESPGIYLMRDGGGKILYVGKALNLRRRLGSYRVANPDRMAARHLRMLRAVERIEVEECVDEEAALEAEARLLRSVRPKFNRAGIWSAAPSFLGWRVAGTILEFGVVEEAGREWRVMGSMRGAWRTRNALARLAWCAANPGRSFAEMPHGWSDMMAKGARRVDCGENLEEVAGLLEILMDGDWLEFAARMHAVNHLGAFDAATIMADLEMAVYGLANLREARRWAN